MEDSHKKATQMIMNLQDRNAKLRLGLGKLLKICKNCNLQNQSEIWQQQIGFAQQMFDETDVNKK